MAHFKLISNCFKSSNSWLCSAEINQVELFNVLQLSIRDETVSLSGCLDNYFKDEIIHNYSCDDCNSVHDIVKTHTANVLPPYLLLQLKRFSNSTGKIEKHITFPFKFNFASQMNDVKTKTTYDLYAIIAHQTFPSHYYACIKASNNKWYKLDDDKVTCYENTDDVLIEQAYMLFYQSVFPKSNATTTLSEGDEIISPTTGTTNTSLVNSCETIQTDCQNYMMANEFKRQMEFQERKFVQSGLKRNRTVYMKEYKRKRRADVNYYIQNFSVIQ